VRLTAISWNLFHGRDFPPDPRLRTWRSRLLRISERNATHIQVNRDLEAEFAAMLAGWEWDVALLQECPPRFAEPLADATRAEGHLVLTSRNSLAPLRRVAAELNPDLIASGEGGSNLTLVRATGALGPIAERRGMAIHEGRPERRAMAFTRTESGVCVANLHATNDIPSLAAEDVRRAAAAATEWAAGAPLLFGGDLNLRPGESPGIFTELEDRFRLTGTTAPEAIDHLLVSGLAQLGTPVRWPGERRELELDGLALRLSDHAPLESRLETSS
jgi:endonuclease/exonuclease/phosphatase family metal-dependent hydrolase